MLLQLCYILAVSDDFKQVFVANKVKPKEQTSSYLKDQKCYSGEEQYTPLHSNCDTLICQLVK